MSKKLQAFALQKLFQFEVPAVSRGRLAQSRQFPTGIAETLPSRSHTSLDRALAILELFSEERPRLRVGDVAKTLDYSESTASRLLARLEAHGFAEREQSTGFYRLGPEILTLAGVAMNHSDLRRAAVEEMHRLVNSLGLGANLAVLHKRAVFYLANLDGQRAPRYYTLLGRHYPLHATALGKVLLAWRDPSDVSKLLVPNGQRVLPSYTNSTLADLDALVSVLSNVQQSGYATENEELAMGRVCLAAPIRGADGRVVAAMSISGPVQVVDLPNREESLAAGVIDAAMTVSERLGFRGASSRDEVAAHSGGLATTHVTARYRRVETREG